MTFGLHEVDVLIWDRRSGERVGKRTFPPDTGCPGGAVGREGAIGANSNNVVEWLERQLAKGKVEG